MRKALATLPWVEQDSVNADVNTHQVTFAVTDKSKFDQEAVKKALDDVGFNEMKLVSGPEKQ